MPRPYAKTKAKNGRDSYMCRSCNTERARKYRATKTGKAKTYRAIYKSIEKHQEKQRARTIVSKEVKRGKIIKPDICSVCREGRKVEAHHPDYSRPKEVVWVCRQCHADLHRSM